MSGKFLSEGSSVLVLSLLFVAVVVVTVVERGVGWAHRCYAWPSWRGVRQWCGADADAAV